MYIIPCSDDCLYQKDGYCMLETSSGVNNVTDTHCIYYIKNSNKDVLTGENIEDKQKR